MPFFGSPTPSFFISDSTAMAFYLPLVFPAITTAFSLLLISLTLTLFGPTDGELAWFVAMPRVENSLEIVKEKCTMSKFCIIYLNASSLSEVFIIIGSSRAFVQAQTWCQIVRYCSRTALRMLNYFFWVTSKV